MPDAQSLHTPINYIHLSLVFVFGLPDWITRCIRVFIRLSQRSSPQRPFDVVDGQESGLFWAVYKGGWHVSVLLILPSIPLSPSLAISVHSQQCLPCQCLCIIIQIRLPFLTVPAPLLCALHIAKAVAEASVVECRGRGDKSPWTIRNNDTGVPLLVEYYTPTTDYPPFATYTKHLHWAQEHTEEDTDNVVANNTMAT